MSMRISVVRRSQSPAQLQGVPSRPWPMHLQRQLHMPRPAMPSPVTRAPQCTALVSYPAHVAQAYPAQAYPAKASPAQVYPAHAYPAQAYPAGYPATAPAQPVTQPVIQPVSVSVYPSGHASVPRCLSADTQVPHTITAKPAIDTVSTYKVCLKGDAVVGSLAGGFWRLTAGGWGQRVETSNWRSGSDGQWLKVI